MKRQLAHAWATMQYGSLISRMCQRAILRLECSTPTSHELSSPIFQSLLRIGVTWPDLHLFRNIKAHRPFTNHNWFKYQPLQLYSYTDPVHSFITSRRTVEPTGSSFMWSLDIFAVDCHICLIFFDIVDTGCWIYSRNTRSCPMLNLCFCNIGLCPCKTLAARSPMSVSPTWV